MRLYLILLMDLQTYYAVTGVDQNRALLSPLSSAFQSIAVRGASRSADDC